MKPTRRLASILPGLLLIAAALALMSGALVILDGHIGTGLLNVAIGVLFATTGIGLLRRRSLG